jgi:hypothetical protein
MMKPLDDCSSHRVKSEILQLTQTIKTLFGCHHNIFRTSLIRGILVRTCTYQVLSRNGKCFDDRSFRNLERSCDMLYARLVNLGA